MAGPSVDVLQGATKRTARRGKRVGKVDDLDAERREVALELVALFGALLGLAVLARIGARAVKPLLDALADADGKQQRIAIDVLGNVANKNAGPALFAPSRAPLRASPPRTRPR